MKKPPSSQPQDKYVLRLPDGLRDRIKAASDASGRSMNAEIVRVLDTAFPAPEPVRLSLPEVLRLQDAWREAMNYELTGGPSTSDILREVWRIQTGDDEDVDPRARDAVRAILAEIGRKP